MKFLRESGYVTAFRRDPDRVWACLNHRSCDVRIAAAKCLAHFPTDPIVSQIITTMANSPSWEKGGAYPVARLIAPFVSQAQESALIGSFPQLAFRNETAYQILCQRCPSRSLQKKLETYLFSPDADQETCHLALKSILAVSGLNQKSLLERCLHHRYRIISSCARHCLQQHSTG
jgi:hypothetical protein